MDRSFCCSTAGAWITVPAACAGFYALLVTAGSFTRFCAAAAVTARSYALPFCVWITRFRRGLRLHRITAHTLPHPAADLPTYILVSALLPRSVRFTGLRITVYRLR